MKKIALAIVCTFASALPLLALPGMPDGKWWKRSRVVSEIGLSSEQSREIDAIFVRARTRLIDLKAELEKKELGLQQAMEDTAPGRETVENRIEEVEDARSELQKARALMILDMRHVLKPEQWERLLEMRHRAGERRRSTGKRRFRGQDSPEDRPRPSDRR